MDHVTQLEVMLLRRLGEIDEHPEASIRARTIRQLILPDGIHETSLREAGGGPIITTFLKSGTGTMRVPAGLADLNRELAVDGTDLSVTLVFWGPRNGEDCGADLDQTGIVDGADLTIAPVSWGDC